MILLLLRDGSPLPLLLATELLAICSAWSGCIRHAGAFGRKQHVGVLTAVTALLPYPHAAIQTRLSATSAPLHSVMPSTTTPEPRQAALATELLAICSAWSGCIRHAQGPLAARSTMACSPR